MSAGWGGDDLRWFSKYRRKLRMGSSGNATPIRRALILSNIAMFVYQTFVTVRYIRMRHPEYWPRQAAPIVFDALIGSSINGPMVTDFAFSNALSHRQPHRYLTAGFLHGGILHLILNLDALWNQPKWLEDGLGRLLYLSTFLVSIVAGNAFHFAMADSPMDRVFVIGSSGGILGLYGLMFAALVRMGNKQATRRIARGLFLLFVTGTLIDGISTAAHVGGFLAGLVMGILFGPGYRKSYSLRRANSLDYDPVSRGFRQAMGFGVLPTNRGFLPLSLLWGGIVVFSLLAAPKFQSIPQQIIKGLMHPGSLS